MFVSLAIAVVAPFHLFLLAYAVLGPLHYLTGISWLHDRQFFTGRIFSRKAVSFAFEIGMFLLVFAAAGVVMFSGREAYGMTAYLLITIVHVFLFTGIVHRGRCHEIAEPERLRVIDRLHPDSRSRH